MISREAIDKILDAARIEDVVGDFVMLKKKGSNLWGNCPFHNEKTPSFAVSPAKGLFKCFGCSKGGNSVNFIMEHEQLTYPEALRYLAKKYQIAIEESEPTPEELLKQGWKESLSVACSFAQKYFSDNLINKEEGKAIGLSYFHERGFVDHVIEKFQLGYAFSKKHDFTAAALAEGFKLDVLTGAGLSISNEYGNIDRFHSRVIFPIHGISGKVIGFGGRTLSADKKIAKYINSPETDIYSKTNVLYGLFFAKKSIVAEDNCFLVEGYTDVISMSQAGIENVVSSSGTSLTSEQIRLIKRYTSNITILYDGDNAGIKASFRGIDLILTEGLNVRVLLFPDGDDPDSFSKKHTSEEIRDFIKKNTRDFISFKAGLLMKEAQGDPIRKSQLAREIIESISLIDDQLTRSLYIKESCRILEMDEPVLNNELNKIRRSKFKKTLAPGDGGSEIPDPEFIQEPQSGEETIYNSEHQERDIIRILVHFGDWDIHFSITNDENEVEERPVNVAWFIINELTGDQIEFENPLYQKFFNEMRSIVEAGDLPEQTHFSKHHDPEINNFAGSLLIAKYVLSENWKNHNIRITTEEMVLKQSTVHSVYALKLSKLMKLIDEEQLKLKGTAPEAEAIKILEEIKRLQESKKIISGFLGRVINR